MSLNFAAMARQSERQSSTVMVPKGQEQPESPRIHTLGASELRQPAKRISKVNESVRELAREMLRSMYSAQGIGLAAPQVGVHQQLLVIDLDPEEAANPPLVLINPEVVATSGELDTYEEGCLSIPGVYLNVVRPSQVDIKYRDELGRPLRRKADGLMARCILHEMDHLNGVLFVDRVTDELSLNGELQRLGFNRNDVHTVS
ncbi:MAG: peptide deformylase [Synechococcus sp. TMED19]|nr:MAG: peptide deformylase [Synechococcus sp. TMED19]